VHRLGAFISSLRKLPKGGARLPDSAQSRFAKPLKTRVFGPKRLGTAFAIAVKHNPSQEFYKMKKPLLAIALASSLTSFGAVAADKAPEPDFSISGNFGLFSDYRFRGMSQTNKAMAAQGGFDLAHKSGLYAGTWTSNVADWANTGGNGQELDVYGGFRTELVGVGVDIGYLAYIYPGNTANPKQNTEEAYIGLSYGPVSYKVSVAGNKWFGYAGSGSIYQDLSAAFSLSDKVTFGLHVGFQDVKHTSADLDFTDYKASISYALPDNYTLGLAYVTTSGLTESAKTSNFTGGGKKLYDGGAVISLTKTF
jgi:uncharacterized protein (TIGR02001 family)